MDWSFWLPLLVLATSLATAVLVFPLREEARAVRSTLNVAGAALKVVLVGVMVWQTARGVQFEARLPFTPGVELVLRADFLALLFAALSSALWFLTTLYAIGYLERSPQKSRFFGFFSLSVTATMGIALAGDLLTFFVFYEMLTITTFPLVVHRGTGEALAAGRTYLLYTLSGGVLLLAGVAWLYGLVGPVEFAAGGSAALRGAGSTRELAAVLVLLLAGLGVKAALVPLHGWLPQAMVAPAPVSALLHAVAVVKAGVFGIVRVVHDVFGIAVVEALGVLGPLAAVAAFTVVYGSLRALAQDSLKRMLAYSTVSQLSYIVLGTALLGPLAAVGGLVHLMHQGIMKVTLFYCAGAVEKTLGIHRIGEMDGVGRRMPVTMAAFTVAAFGMIGIPPTAGFISKWYLGLGGLAAGQGWVVAVLAASGVLNAMYFLPVVYRGWFGEAEEGEGRERPEGLETSRLLLFPMVATALVTVAAGVLAGAPFSPLDLARRAVEGIYAR